MNSNELREHVKKLNEIEQVQIEQRRQIALAKIYKLREQIRQNRLGNNNENIKRIPAE